MVVHGNGNHAQEKACRQEQAYASMDTRTATIIEILGYDHNHMIL
jgi:hypothetical protein